MQRCGSYQCYSAGECSCEAAFYGQQTTFFSMPAYNNNYYESQHYSFQSSSPVVDCTLSLGTPSTRMTEFDEKRREEQQSASNFAWDLSRTKHPPSSKSGRRGGDKSSSNADQMLARHCANCDTTTTPLWRNGPSGPKVTKPIQSNLIQSNPIQSSVILYLTIQLIYGFDGLLIIWHSRYAMRVGLDTKRKREKQRVQGSRRVRCTETRQARGFSTTRTAKERPDSHMELGMI